VKTTLLLITGIEFTTLTSSDHSWTKGINQKAFCS